MTASRVRDAERYLNADPRANLTRDDRSELIRDLLAGPVTDDALLAVIRLLSAIEPRELRRLLWGGRLAETLTSAVPPGHQHRGELDTFIGQRLAEPPRRELRDRRRIIVWRTQLLRPFQPEMISPSLAGDRPDGDLTPEQFENALLAVGGRPNEAVLRRLGLSAAERAAGGTWLDRLRDAARQRDRIAEYHSGDPHFDLETADIRRLIEESLEGLVREHALALLECESADETLIEMFDDGALRPLLDRAIPAGHYLSDRLARFRLARFRNGHVLPRVQPRLSFSLDMISRSLAGISATEVPDPEEFKLIGRVLAGRSDEDIVGRLPRLDPVQRALVRWWLREVCAPARLVRRAEEHHSGDPALILDLAGQRQLIGDLLDGPAQWQALTMLEQADHRDLAGLYADGGLDRLLTRKIVSAYRDRLDGSSAAGF